MQPVRRLLGGLVLLLLLGCVDGTQRARPEVVAADSLMLDDFVVAGSAIIQSMSNSPALNRRPPATIQLGLVNNDSVLNLDAKALLERATVSLFKTGRVKAMAATGEANGKPDLILRGRIYEGRNAAGKSRGPGYWVRLTLIEVTTGAYIWSEERKVQKRVRAEAETL